MRSTRAVAVLVGLVLLTAALATDAEAHEGEAITFEARPGASVTRTFDTPMVSDGALIHDPGACAASPACLEYALEVIEPTSGADWVLDIAVDWSAIDLDTGLAGGADSADIDLFVYQEETVVDENGEPAAEWVQIASSETQGGRPERVKLFTPRGGAYVIAVAVFAGATDGSVLTLEFVDASFEFPAPETPSAPGGDPTPTRPAPEEVGSEVTPQPDPSPTGQAAPRRSLAVEPSPTSRSDAEPAGPTFGPPTGTDADFGARFATLDGRLGEGNAEPLSLVARRQGGIVEPVSLGTVLLFAVGIPLAGVGLAVLAAFKLRPLPTRMVRRRHAGGDDG